MPVPILFADFAISTLPTAVGTSQTTIPLATGTGALFPSPSGGHYFYLTLADFATNGVTSHEVVKVTGRSGDLLTGCTRGQGGTNPTAFNPGDKAELRFCAQAAADIVADLP